MRIYTEWTSLTPSLLYPDIPWPQIYQGICWLTISDASKQKRNIKALSLLYLNTEDYMDAHSFHHPANDTKDQAKLP